MLKGANWFYTSLFKIGWKGNVKEKGGKVHEGTKYGESLVRRIVEGRGRGAKNVGEEAAEMGQE